MASYTLWIKAKKLKADHDALKTEFEALKANKAQKIKEDLKQQESTPVYQTEKSYLKEQSLQDILREQYQCTDREIEVITCIWDGLSNKDIADKLSITLSTTKQHVSNAYIKLDVKSRSQAMIIKNEIIQQSSSTYNK
ncbi:helix-turn-helix domain-containing protein [Myroides marinus]|uniref:helix-turn-helix domain-containing protein n=1 Tax=Myroides marinus TaxID=703342 RepID=UPI002577CE53|nr:helix-turn-helix transcriptional regulator [Myroides marinus]